MDNPFLCVRFVIKMTPSDTASYNRGVHCNCCSDSNSGMFRRCSKGLFMRNAVQDISSKIKSGHPHASVSTTVCARGFWSWPEVQQSVFGGGWGLTMSSNRPAFSITSHFFMRTACLTVKKRLSRTLFRAYFWLKQEPV